MSVCSRFTCSGLVLLPCAQSARRTLRWAPGPVGCTVASNAEHLVPGLDCKTFGSVHVSLRLLPFYSSSGTMTECSWTKSSWSSYQNCFNANWIIWLILGLSIWVSWLKVLKHQFSNNFDQDLSDSTILMEISREGDVSNTCLSKITRQSPGDHLDNWGSREKLLEFKSVKSLVFKRFRYFRKFRKTPQTSKTFRCNSTRRFRS